MKGRPAYFNKIHISQKWSRGGTNVPISKFPFEACRWKSELTINKKAVVSRVRR